MKAKIFTPDELAHELSLARSNGKRISHCHGVFDLVHPGHLRHLRAARLMADILVVSITADKFVNKGPSRPAFNEMLRAEFLSAFDFVDYVVINRAESSEALIESIKPDFYVKGSDYFRREDDPTGNIIKEEDAVLRGGGLIRFTDQIVFSSSQLINQHLTTFPPEVEKWLADFRKSWKVDEILGWLERASKQRVVVFGEPIIDEYLFCAPLGKSSKDPILAFHQRSIESYPGGTLAIANHLAGLGCEVKLVCQIGDDSEHDNYMRSHLLPKVEPILLPVPNVPNIIKRRVVDSHTGNKLIELYSMSEHPLEEGERNKLFNNLRGATQDSDLLLVADYGHGMIDRKLAEKIGTIRCFTSLNCQSNAGNRGFNPLSKYARADYVCIAEHEAHIELRDTHLNISEMSTRILNALKSKFLTITRGRMGTVHTQADGTGYHSPALATQVNDRVGAGDGVLAITSVLHSVGCPQQIVAFLGNIAGAYMVGDLGNRRTLTYTNIGRSVQTLLK